MKTIEIEPIKKGSKIIKGNRAIILLGQPPFTIDQDDFHYVSEFFRKKEKKEKTPAELPDKEGKK